MTTKTIDVKCGIYDTEYTIRIYGTTAIVTAPYIRWQDDSGSLDFYKRKITNPTHIAKLKEMAANNSLVDFDTNYPLTITDIIGE